jgi:uncharacterized metal-binding protein YceD (DUF177 family)
MKRLAEFSLPIQGLKVGFHVFEFQIDEKFFAEFEDSSVQNGDINVTVNLDRHPEMLVFDFEISGTVRTECDRCLAEIDLPIESENRLIVKFSENPTPTDDDELVFIHPETGEYNLGNYIYESIVLAIPMIRVIEDCEEEEQPNCDFEMLKRLKSAENNDSDRPFKDILKGFKEN